VVGAASSDARAVRVEGNARNHAGVFVESAHTLLAAHVPQLDRLVIAAGEDKPVVWRQLCRPYPIDVACIPQVWWIVTRRVLGIREGENSED